MINVSKKTKSPLSSREMNECSPFLMNLATWLISPGRQAPTTGALGSRRRMPSNNSKATASEGKPRSNSTASKTSLVAAWVKRSASVKTCAVFSSTFRNVSINSASAMSSHPTRIRITMFLS